MLRKVVASCVTGLEKNEVDTPKKLVEEMSPLGI